MTVDELATAYTTARPRLVSVAYAILGSRAEAEDVVSDVWLKLAAVSEPVRDVEAWAVTAVGRAALDVYRSARRRRETYVGPWLPEPIVQRDGTDPADRVTLDESVSFALLVVLESLTPAERTAFVLHDLFSLPFDEVAQVVGRSPAAVRQLASRARQHLAERAPRVPVDAAGHRAAVEQFLAAANTGRLADLLAVLDPDVELVSDGGGVVRAALRPVLGADRVGRFLLGIASKFDEHDVMSVVDVNGLAGIVTHRDGVLNTVTSLTFEHGRVVRVDIVRAPAKLR